MERLMMQIAFESKSTKLKNSEKCQSLKNASPRKYKNITIILSLWFGWPN